MPQSAASAVQTTNRSDLTMSSRDIADLVESRHTVVCRSIDRLMASGVIGGYAPMAYTHPQNGQTYYEYFVGKRDSYVIVAQLSPEFTARLVDRWQELEAKHAARALPDFTNPVEAARAWADAKEAEIQAKAELALAAPKVEFVDKYVDSTGLMGFRQVCKLLKAKENDFRAFLEDNKIMYRLGGAMTPYAQHIDAGRFEVKTGTAANDHTFNSAKFTPKGVEWISKVWRKKSEA